MVYTFPPAPRHRMVGSTGADAHVRHEREGDFHLE
jgi:hypothetical protein